MQKSRKSSLVVGSFLVAALALGMPMSVDADAAPGQYSLFDGSWGDWIEGDPYDLENVEFGDATAAMGIISFFGCVEASQPEGSARNFSSVVVDSCANPEPNGVSILQDSEFVDAGMFAWAALNGQGEFVLQDCVDVTINVRTTGDVEAGVSFSEFEPYTTFARQRFENQVGFIVDFGIEAELPGDGDGVWMVEVSISDCVSRIDLGIDPETFLRRGDEVTALPDTL